MQFECDVFGKVGLGGGASATLGLGAEADADLEVDFHNAAWGAANLFWACLNERGWQNKGKVWLLPVEENVKMCGKARDALFLLIGDLYRQNEADLQRLQAWSVLETQVKTAVLRRNPRLTVLLGS